LQLLKGDPKAIFAAAARASEAVHYLKALQPTDPRARTIPAVPSAETSAHLAQGALL
jgi:antirestriction protein ArdC